MHAQRMVNLTFALLLAASPLAAQQSIPESQGFSFTSVDLELLEKSNQLDKQLQEKGLVFNEPDTTRYITKVGRNVLPAGPELQSVHWQFFVLRDPTPNAFALPNGSIYVHTGLLALLDNEAQLAGVLAHEETHVLETDTSKIGVTGKRQRQGSFWRARPPLAALRRDLEKESPSAKRR